MGNHKEYHENIASKVLNLENTDCTEIYMYIYVYIKITYG